jgi:hypothetical protein
VRCKPEQDCMLAAVTAVPHAASTNSATVFCRSGQLPQCILTRSYVVLRYTCSWQASLHAVIAPSYDC